MGELNDPVISAVINLRKSKSMYALTWRSAEERERESERGIIEQSIVDYVSLRKKKRKIIAIIFLRNARRGFVNYCRSRRRCYYNKIDFFEKKKGKLNARRRGKSITKFAYEKN